MFSVLVLVVLLQGHFLAPPILAGWAFWPYVHSPALIQKGLSLGGLGDGVPAPLDVSHNRLEPRRGQLRSLANHGTLSVS